MNKTVRGALGCFLSVCLMVGGGTGCARKGSEFIGKWVNSSNKQDTMEIVPNGDEYLLVDNGKRPLGLVYKDGGLEASGMMGRVTLTYVRSTDTLLVPGFMGQSEYKREK